MSDNESNIGLMLVNTVRGNFEGYTRKEIERAREARQIQGMITYMVVTLLTSGEKRLEENQSMFRLIMCRSLGIL